MHVAAFNMKSLVCGAVGYIGGHMFTWLAPHACHNRTGLSHAVIAAFGWAHLIKQGSWPSEICRNYVGPRLF
jgi:hypothetical protein